MSATKRVGARAARAQVAAAGGVTEGDGADDREPSTGALWLACSKSPAYFLSHYGSVYDPLLRGWTSFNLWPGQVEALRRLERGRLAVILKARQLGMSWLTVGCGLWHMIFRPAATVLLFSQRDDEAVQLLNFRLRGMYNRLPPQFKARAVERDNAHEFRLSNGSTALAFPTTGGRSYTASIAIVDEADHTDDLDGLLNAVKPTIDAGGRLILLSTVDKTRPESPLKRIYRAAVRGENDYTPIFLPWSANPGRTPEWYEAQAFAHAVAALRDRALILHDESTYWQLASIDGGTMRAPQGQHDDRALACILALAAIEFCGAHRPVPSVIIPPKPLWEPTPGGW